MSGGEIPQGAVQEKHKPLEAQEYQWAKTRIEASKRIAHELGQGLHQQRNATVNVVDSMVRDPQRLQPRADATGYGRQKVKMVYHSLNNTESMSEELVFFLKPDAEGNPEMLEVAGRPLFLNGDLYDAQYINSHYAGILSEDRRLVPTVDHQGQITSVVYLREKGDQS